MLDLNKRPLSLSPSVKTNNKRRRGRGEEGVGVGGGAIKKQAKAKHRKIKLSSIFIINAIITTRPAISNEERGEGALIKTNGKDGKYVERQAEH